MTTTKQPAKVTPSQLVGTWINTDKATNDIVKIIITASGSAISVEVFGAWVPSPLRLGFGARHRLRGECKFQPGGRLQRSV